LGQEILNNNIQYIDGVTHCGGRFDTLFVVSRQGPLGSANLLYTQTAIIMGEFILIFPVIVALTIAGVQSVDERVGITARTLGAKTTQLVFSILWEARISLISAFVNAFGRVIAELGIAIMLGGNIRGSTRTLTTAIALETSRGEFALAIALGFILLFLACGVNIVLQLLQRRAG
jgi:tungstate transport system permease protein